MVRSFCNAAEALEHTHDIIFFVMQLVQMRGGTQYIQIHLSRALAIPSAKIIEACKNN